MDTSQEQLTRQRRKAWLHALTIEQFPDGRPILQARGVAKTFDAEGRVYHCALAVAREMFQLPIDEVPVALGLTQGLACDIIRWNDDHLFSLPEIAQIVHAGDPDGESAQ